MKKLTICALGLAMSVNSVYADDYQFEIGADYFNTDVEGFDLDAYTINGEIYFSSVDTSKGALAEAPFLDHASGVFASWTDVEDADDNIAALGLRYVTQGDFIVEASFSDDGDSNNFGLGLGWYLNDTTDLVFSFDTNDDTDVDTLSADFHSVIGLKDGMSFAYTLVASYIDADFDEGFQIGGDATLYMTSALGLTVLTEYTEIGDFDSSTYGMELEWFIVPQFRAAAFYTNTSIDSFDVEVMGVSASARF